MVGVPGGVGTFGTGNRSVQVNGHNSCHSETPRVTLEAEGHSSDCTNLWSADWAASQLIRECPVLSTCFISKLVDCQLPDKEAQVEGKRAVDRPMAEGRIEAELSL